MIPCFEVIEYCFNHLCGILIMSNCFQQGRESEHNWLDREKSIVRIRGMLKGGVHLRFADAFVAGLKGGVLEKTVKGVSDPTAALSSRHLPLLSRSS